MREGKERSYSYRFSDPMMQPYVVMSSLTDGLISTQQLSELQGEARIAEPKADEAYARGQLF